MRTLLPITLTTLLLAATAISAQAQTDPTNPNVVAPDGVCTRIPNPADLNGPDIPDETDPDCHEAGLIYQQVPDTHIDAHVDTTGTDWATACRALGVTVGPLPAGHDGSEPHTYETSERTRAAGDGTNNCVSYTIWARDAARRDRTVYDCREGGAHSTAAGDGHAHTWLAEPWGAWQWTETARWAEVDTTNCPTNAPTVDDIILTPRPEPPPTEGHEGHEETTDTDTDTDTDDEDTDTKPQPQQTFVDEIEFAVHVDQKALDAAQIDKETGLAFTVAGLGAIPPPKKPEIVNAGDKDGGKEGDPSKPAPGDPPNGHDGPGDSQP